MGKSNKKAKMGKKAMKGVGKLMSSMSKTTKKALMHMPKGERGLVLSTMNSTGAAWSKKRIMDRTKPGADSTDLKATSTNRSSAQQSASALFSKPEQRILVVGDGNFSFSAALVHIFNGNGSSITATCYDSRETLLQKYPDAKKHVKFLKSSGASVFYDVDATMLQSFGWLDPPYDLIIFNFPHVGLGIKDQDSNVAANQKLVGGFVHSAQPFIHSQGAVCVTVKKGAPYDAWKVARLGLSVPGLRLKTAVDFDPASFPSFSHRRTAGERSDAAEEDNGLIQGGAKTFVFTAEKAASKDKKDAPKAKGRGGKGNVSRGIGKRNRK